MCSLYIVIKNFVVHKRAGQGQKEIQEPAPIANYDGAEEIHFTIQLTKGIIGNHSKPINPARTTVQPDGQSTNFIYRDYSYPVLFGFAFLCCHFAASDFVRRLA